MTQSNDKRHVIAVNRGIGEPGPAMQRSVRSKKAGDFHGVAQAHLDVAQKLSLQVAELQKQIGEMRQTDLIELALKDGKTSPAELDDWGRELAKTSPEQFRKIVLSRPAGSVVPVQGIHLGKETPAAGVPDDVQLSVNKQMGLDDETFKKYNK